MRRLTSEGRARGGRSFGHRDREAAFPFAGAQSARRPVAFFESDGGRQPSLRVGGRAGRASCGLPRWVDRERCAAPFRATFVQVQLATYLVARSFGAFVEDLDVCSFETRRCIVL